MKTHFAPQAVRLGRFLLACAFSLVLSACGTPAPAPATSQPATVAVALPDTSNGRIAVIEAQGTVYTINPDGSDRSFVDIPDLVNNAAVAWSRDSTRLALGTVHRDEGSKLIVSDSHGRNPLTIYGGPLFGVPFYLSWSPSSEHIAFLANRASDGDLSLRTIHASGGETAALVADGSPSYFSWAPDGQRMLLHIGAQDGLIGIHTLGVPEIERRDTQPGIFQAPAWSPISEAYIFARSTGSGGAGEVVLLQDGRESTLFSYRGFVNFSWSPDGSRIAYSLLTEDSSQFDQLSVIDVQSGNSQTLVSGGHLAYYWSPDSKRLAYLTFRLIPNGTSGQNPQGRDFTISNPAQAENTLELTWHVVDVESGQNIRLISYQPTGQFTFTIAYFDQYAQSASLWSPDSRYLLLIGRPAGLESAIYRVDTLVGATDNIERIGPGDYAVWSWK